MRWARVAGGVFDFHGAFKKIVGLAQLFFKRIYYRELMYYVVAKSLIYAVRGRVVEWGKLERRATVRGV